MEDDRVENDFLELGRSERLTRKRKVLIVVVKILHILVFLVGFIVLLIILFRVGHFIYNRTQNPKENLLTERSLDIYGVISKKEPLETFDVGQYRFEIKTKEPIPVRIFLKVHLILGYDHGKSSSSQSQKSKQNLVSLELEERKLQIQDITRTLLSQKTYQELKDENEILRVKNQLMNRVNHVLINGKIVDVYVAEWSILPAG